PGADATISGSTGSSSFCTNGGVADGEASELSTLKEARGWLALACNDAEVGENPMNSSDPLVLHEARRTDASVVNTTRLPARTKRVSPTFKPYPFQELRVPKKNTALKLNQLRFAISPSQHRRTES